MALVHTRYTAAEACRVGFDLHLRGEFVAAARVYTEAVTDGAPPQDLARLAAAAASTAWAQGEVERCREQVEEAMRLAEESGDDTALAAALTAQALLGQIDGDDNLAGRASYLAGHHARAAGDEDAQVRILINVGVRANAAGQHELALGSIADALELQPQMPVLVRAHAEYVRGAALLALGRVDEAFATFDDARRIWQRFGAPQGALALHGIGITNMARGRASQAAAAFREAIGVARRQHGAQMLVPSLAGLARVTVTDDPAECDDALVEARDYPVGVWCAEVELAEGWVALARGQRDKALALGRSAEREAGRRHDGSALADALELISLATRQDRPDGRLAEARMLWEEHGNAVRVLTNEIVVAQLSRDAGAESRARRRLRALGVREDTQRIAGPLLVVGAPSGAAVRVHALGAFTIEREGRLVSQSEWGSPRTRRALAILSGATDGISRDELAGLLGPGDGDSLDETLAGCRAVLDPLARHAADLFLRERGELLVLDPYEVDVDVAHARRAAYACLGASAPAQHELEAAIALFTGQFLEELDEPWAWDVRRELAELSRALRRRVAMTSDSPQEALRWWYTLAHDDPSDAEAVSEVERLLGEVEGQDRLPPVEGAPTEAGSAGV
jgi:cellulose synthase operon protein C